MRATVPKYAPTEESRLGVEQVIEGIARDLDDVACEVADAIHSHLPDELDRELYDRTLRSTRSNIEMILTMLQEGVNPYEAVLLPEPLAYAKDFVRQGRALEVLLRVYRRGEAAFARIWLDRLREMFPQADLLAQAFGFFNEWLFAWSERLESQLSEAYTTERDRWVRGTAALWAEEVRAILENRHGDPRRASRQLNYEFDREHLGYVIWINRVDSETSSERLEHVPYGEMEGLAAEVAQLVDARGQLTVRLGSCLACWAGSWSFPTLGELPARLPLARDYGLQVAVGNPGRGLEGFRRTHEEALMARDVSRLGRSSPGRCVRFPSVALDALLTHNTDEARQFVATELEGLADDSDATRRLRTTLMVFLDERGSFLHAAQRLGVHENTISYRVRRAEDLLGRRVAERTLELMVALRLARLTL